MKINIDDSRFDAVIDAINGDTTKLDKLIKKEAHLLTEEVMENTRIGDTTPQPEEIRKTIEQLAKSVNESIHKIEVEVLEGGKLPAKAHASDAGFDLFATEDIIIWPGQIVKHPLNIKMKLPVGSWARIETKSGLGSKGMLVYAGVVDRNYRGVPHVICTNLNTKNPAAIEIKKGQKIAQMTMNPHSEEFYVVQVDEVASDTDRGAGGFGSTGA